MSRLFAWCQRRTALLALAAVALVAIIGVGAFALAIRPCRWHLPTGTVVGYRLETVVTAVDEQGEALGEPTRSQGRLVIVAIASGEVLVLVGREGRPWRPLHLALAANGRVRRRGARSEAEAAAVIGVLDLNLFPLPAGAEQSWTTDIAYGAVPADRRPLTARVRRLRNGLQPGFRLELPAVEWTGPSGHYHQVRNLVSDYRFDLLRGVLAGARVELLRGRELPEPATYRRERVRIGLELVELEYGEAADDSRHALALALVAAHEALGSADRSRLVELDERLAGIDISQADMAAARAEMRDRLEAHLATSAGEGWAVQVASAPRARVAAAEALRRDLERAGFPAFIARRGEHLLIAAGPYGERDPAVLATLAARFPRNRPFWIRHVR